MNKDGSFCLGCMQKTASLYAGYCRDCLEIIQHMRRMEKGDFCKNK